MRKILTFCLAAAIFLALPAFAEAPKHEVVKEKSFLKFYAIQNNAPVAGSFENFTADIRFDPNKVEESSIAVEVDTGSVSASNPDIVSNLKLPEWLSTQAFPKAVFKSKKITRMPQSDNYFAEGELTLRDKTVPIMLNFQLEHPTETDTIAKGFATLHRNDFGVGQGEWAKDDVVKNEVRVEFRIFATRK